MTSESSHIRFYDNDATNVMNVKIYCKSIECFHVSEEPSITENEYMDSHIENIANITNYTAVSKRMLDHDLASGRAGEIARVSLGITAEMIDELIHWSKIPSDEVKRVIFDWDRTITRVEGFLTPPALVEGETIETMFRKSRYDITPDQIINYIISPDRIDPLKKLYIELRSNGVEIYILTNNSVAESSMSAFYQIVSLIFPVPRDHVFCSRGTDKGLFLKNTTDNFFSACRNYYK